MGAGMGGVRVGWVRSRGGGRPGRVFFLTRGGRSRGPHGPSVLRGRTLRATSLMGRWKLALSTSSVMLLDWPHPRFCDGEMRVGELRGWGSTEVGRGVVGRAARATTSSNGVRGPRWRSPDGDGKKRTVRFPPSASTRLDRRDDARGNPDPRKAREHLRPRSRHRGDGRGRPSRAVGRVPWASSLSSFLPRFRPRNGKRDFSFSFRVCAVPSTPRGHRQERRVRVRDGRGPHADPRRVGLPAGVLDAGGSLKHCALSHFRRALFSSCQVMLNQPGFWRSLGN